MIRWHRLRIESYSVSIRPAALRRKGSCSGRAQVLPAFGKHWGPSQSRYFGVFDLEGREVARLMDAPSGFDFGARSYDERKNWFVNQGQFDVGPDGRILFSVHPSQPQAGEGVGDNPLGPDLPAPDVLDGVLHL